MKFLKQNLLIIIVIMLLLVNMYRLDQLNAKYNELADRLHFSTVRIEEAANGIYGIKNAINDLKSDDQAIPAKEVMSPSELAKYLNVPMDKIYDMVSTDKTMPYVIINNEYRFNKAAIDKWMDRTRP